MPIPDDFEQESLYTRDAWFIHDVLEIDRSGNRVVGVLDTTRIGAFVDAQRPWPGHEKHLPGAVVIQMTGTLGQLHAVYVLGLRPTEGWVGFGTHLEKATFRGMGRIGPPVQATLHAERVRKVRGTWFVSYAFTFEQEGNRLYESQQTAAWFQGEHRGPLR